VSRLLIVDGHAYAYRAFHAIRGLRSPSGQPTNAIYGFVKMLDKMRLAVEPTHVIVVWDGGLSGERMALLPDYKAQRPEMPEDLRPQLAGIGKYLEATGVAQYCGEGIEADDYIASLARLAEQAGWNVVIASSDKDFMQLVSERIGLLNPNDKSGVLWKDEQVRAKTGVSPGQIVDWLALMGDAVDNIPGVAGVGPKTAAGLLHQFGSIEAMLGRLSEVKSEKVQLALQDSVAAIRRNQELVRLASVPCGWEPEQLAARPADRTKLRELCDGWGFKGISAALNETAIIEKQAELI
jgi:DNA polymerase-1